MIRHPNHLYSEQLRFRSVFLTYFFTVIFNILLSPSRGSTDSIVTRLGAGRLGGSIPGRDREQVYFFLPLRLDRLWASPILLSNGYLGLFPRG